MHHMRRINKCVSS